MITEWCVGIGFHCSTIYTLFLEGLFVTMHQSDITRPERRSIDLYVTVIFNEFTFGFWSIILRLFSLRLKVQSLY